MISQQYQELKNKFAQAEESLNSQIDQSIQAVKIIINKIIQELQCEPNEILVVEKDGNKRHFDQNAENVFEIDNEGFLQFTLILVLDSSFNLESSYNMIRNKEELLVPEIKMDIGVKAFNKAIKVDYKSLKIPKGEYYSPLNIMEIYPDSENHWRDFFDLFFNAIRISLDEQIKMKLKRFNSF